MSVGPINPAFALQQAAGARSASQPPLASAGGGGDPFGQALANSVRALDSGLKAADEQAQAVAAGQGDVQEAVLGMARAELDLRVALAVRDRIVESYRGLERMAL